jgi:transcriptional regulator with XRE-family HTH domain
MSSFQFAPSPRKRVTGRFLTRVHRELQKAYMEEKDARGITQAKLARKLGVHRAVVCRQLAGTANLNLRTLADYAWALDRDINFSMPKRAAATGTNYPVVADTSAEPDIADKEEPQPVSGYSSVTTEIAAAA